MRFDPNGVLTFLEGWNEPRSPGSDGLRKGADRVAEGLQEAGFSVERAGARPGWLPSSVAGSLFLALLLPWPALPLLLWYLLAVDALVPQYPGWIRLGLPFLMIVALGDALWFRVRKAMGEASREGSTHVIGREKTEGNRLARLLVVAPLLSPRRAWLPILEGLLWCLGVYPIIKYLFSPESRQFASLWVLSFDLVVPWLALLLLAHGVPVSPPSPRNGDNRTGPGLLIGLARFWPSLATDRIELWLVATPDPVDLSRVLNSRCQDGKPTLALSLDSPAVGQTLLLWGRGSAGALVNEVADSLWLPHETLKRLPPDPIARNWRVPGVSLASIGGEHGDQPIDPALLAAVAQLVQELALRWGKPTTVQAVSGESPARSSQNPG